MAVAIRNVGQSSVWSVHEISVLESSTFPRVANAIEMPKLTVNDAYRPRPRNCDHVKPQLAVNPNRGRRLAQVDVVAAGPREDAGQVAVDRRVEDRQDGPDGDDEKDVLLGPQARNERRDDGQDESQRVAERVEDEDVAGTELPHEAR